MEERVEVVVAAVGDYVFRRLTAHAVVGNLRGLRRKREFST